MVDYMNLHWFGRKCTSLFRGAMEEKMREIQWYENMCSSHKNFMCVVEIQRISDVVCKVSEICVICLNTEFLKMPLHRIMGWNNLKGVNSAFLKCVIC